MGPVNIRSLPSSQCLLVLKRGFLELSGGTLEDYLEISGSPETFKQKLLTNSERARREISHSNSCTLCGHDFEDLTHALRDCPSAKDV
ncbi:putative LRR receptor-like serine/threonine-protein kinase [Gossypium australe]|uniref:Putative LRR receptor-like serine/threonine-protein kinase n=1 Tax=Gossypium australe TaxID=47621 RepID=A0A5B6VTP3_9ROSI|nr:putative LRR receptor-like serine/threonine-protein kinase [Gossypium australe]